ncbi:putative membrane protein [Crossiella equi]|uniref:Membrane protein n=1 Tax=Crossiella equi TaxID=130796 RepID=A0ABS5AI45_9PSEU|nr:hypothetical protein [Crossiella equi]MBP2476253.1 putative membrane protein [Crossiella equi]
MGLIAVLVALAALLASVANGGYHAMLKSAATKRPGGEPVVHYVQERLPKVGITVALSVLALLMTTGGFFLDVLAIAVGAGAGLTAAKELRSTHERFGKAS